MRTSPFVFASGMKDTCLINTNARIGIKCDGVRAFLLPSYELDKTMPRVLTGTVTTHSDRGLEREAVTTQEVGVVDDGVCTGDPALGLYVS